MNQTTSIAEPIGTWAAAGRQPKIAIIGAGFSGMGAIIKLREAGYTTSPVSKRPNALAVPGATTPTRAFPVMYPPTGIPIRSN